jgi:hypothetical protein
MPDVTLSCPDCGGAIFHSCGAIAGANQPQSLAQSGARAQIAHVLELPGLAPKKVYNQGYDQDFLGFWDVYPLKRDKKKAAKAWRNAWRRLGAISGANEVAAKAQIIAGAIAYRDDPNRLDEFTKYAEGWLNGDCWDDDPLPVRNNGHRPKFDTFAAGLRKAKARRDAGE